ncbi:hypothetical protein M409DRAFT_68734 [Zasmidium cellare ATCC 36951]|uniref:Lactonase family protein n=1 Tax=Zasmidium cellare ATCC 36951 TaxID=1080233 RepID=A0A6A6CB22_ZASCE|nr:uncharacterized protein M409DRAFT_68734 [Zasmidium cellare ATCC 36951]KAF2163112.1 hypothetical protein M409DRAFT_68734 [Zasmidium cellare ATCC 36951]
MAATAVSATNLFVADYSGNITTLNLSEQNGSYTLEKTHENDGCAPNPSWLTIDAGRGLLYCMNEGLAENSNGSLASFIISTDGSLKTVQNTTTPSGPVSGIIYGEPAGQRGIALAHYGGSAVSTWKLENNGSFTENEEFFYYLDQPGPVADRQDAPHEHEAITDPTGQYILVPDLGADVVRVFSWEQESLALKTLESLKAAAGSGPRHAAFYTPSGLPGSTTYFYLVAELASTVTSYAVTYLPDNKGLSFKELSSQPTTGPYTLHRTNAPAEIHISPDNRFVVISNRNDSSFSLPQSNGTIIESDSLSTFALSPDSGELTFHQLWAAGGSFPRHFSISATGNLVAVGLQNDQSVVVLERDVVSGLIGEPVGRVNVGGNVTAVVWDQERALGGLGD